MTKQRLSHAPIAVDSRQHIYDIVVRAKAEGKPVGVVPTMGALHAGHLRLVERCRQECGLTVVTIFVNPTQFAQDEDFDRYPRDLDRDLELLGPQHVDFVFAPSAQEMYRAGDTTLVQPPRVAEPFEGTARPSHFAGVCTIVIKLLHIIPADVAYFGQKDYQQYLVVRKMAEELDWRGKISMVPTVRDADGLALSSRNGYLSAEQRRRALGIPRALQRTAQAYGDGQLHGPALEGFMRRELAEAALDGVDYAAVVDAETLTRLDTVDRPAVALIAARVGQTRLIDNWLLQPHARNT